MQIYIYRSDEINVTVAIPQCRYQGCDKETLKKPTGMLKKPAATLTPITHYHFFSCKFELSRSCPEFKKKKLLKKMKTLHIGVSLQITYLRYRYDGNNMTVAITHV